MDLSQFIISVVLVDKMREGVRVVPDVNSGGRELFKCQSMLT